MEIRVRGTLDLNHGSRTGESEEGRSKEGVSRLKRKAAKHLRSLCIFIGASKGERAGGAEEESRFDSGWM